MRRSLLPLALIIASSGAIGAMAQTTSQDTRGSGDAVKEVIVQMRDGEGNSVGTVAVRELVNGTLFVAELEGLAPGAHGFHIHERGTCEPPGFQSAGSHLNPTGAKHGFDTEGGPHVGDLPNIRVADDGTAVAEFFSAQIVLKSPTVASRAGTAATGAGTGASAAGTTANGPFPLLDNDGSAIMIHDHSDDYADMDSAASRIACGVVGGSQ